MRMSIRDLARRLAGLAGCFLLLGSEPAAAETIRVAVAANFTEPAKAIAAAFQTRTGHVVTLSFGSSGQIYAQVVGGAPFQVLLSGDIERPARAEREGLGMAGTRFTYATGRLVLYSRTPGLVDPAGKVLAEGRFDKLAIADPATAPYGAAALATLRSLGVYARLKPRIVTGGSIAQAYQFTATGAAELGFVALSQVIDDATGSRWTVPARLHPPIEQQAILLAPGRDSAAAKAFLAFLKSPTAVAIIRRRGYEVR